jgi:hypothetical protein
MRKLDACPLCRSLLTEETATCPACGGNLLPYRDIDALTVSYVKLARELLSRGDTASARHVIEQLPQLSSVAEEELAELSAEAAIQEGDFHSAEATLAKASPVVAEELKQELDRQRNRSQLARELYNHSLSAARKGAFYQAAHMLAQAVLHDPAEPTIWALKLKVDLKCGYWQRCYAALAKLDHLAARPPEFHRLEEVLPPTAEHD